MIIMTATMMAASKKIFLVFKSMSKNLREKIGFMSFNNKKSVLQQAWIFINIILP